MILLHLLHKRRQRRLTEASKTFRERISLDGRRRRDRRVTRNALQQPKMSPFAFLFGSGSDQSLISLTGLDYKAFHYILQKFSPFYERYSPYSHDGAIRRLPIRVIRRGRPRSMSAAQCLGLVLSWGRTRGSEMVLCMLFGVTGSVCSLFLRFGRRVLLRVLSKDEKAAVKMPTDIEVQQFKQALSTKYSMLSDVYCLADGLKLYLEQSGDAIIQNMFHNGWKHDHYVGNVFLFAPNGTIIACAVNAPVRCTIPRLQIGEVFIKSWRECMTVAEVVV